MELKIEQAYRDSTFEKLNTHIKDNDLCDDLENKIFEYSVFILLGLSFVKTELNIIIKPCSFQAENPNDLVPWEGRIYHWAEHIEKGFNTKLFTNRTNGFHCWMKQRCMQNTNTSFINRTF